MDSGSEKRVIYFNNAKRAIKTESIVRTVRIFPTLVQTRLPLMDARGAPVKYYARVSIPVCATGAAPAVRSYQLFGSVVSRLRVPVPIPIFIDYFARNSNYEERLSSIDKPANTFIGVRRWKRSNDKITFASATIDDSNYRGAHR